MESYPAFKDFLNDHLLHDPSLWYFQPDGNSFEEAHSRVSAVERHSLHCLDLCTCYPFQKRSEPEPTHFRVSRGPGPEALLSVFTESSQVELC